MKSGLLCSMLMLVIGAGTAGAQVLVAHDDSYSIPYGEPLIVEFYGVLDNDLLDGEDAGALGATAHLIVDAHHGSLMLNPNGSFSYTPDLSFDGSDEFVYSAEFDTLSAQATVTLSACEGGPEVFTCWNETAFLAKVAGMGYATFQEGFEDDVVWGDARTPLSMPGVSSQGILWQSNHPDPPALNPISTTPGPPHSGLWAIYDPRHGYATGSEILCDVDDPDPECLYHDGFTGIRESGFDSLHGVGGYITGSFGFRVTILLDGGLGIGGGQVGGGGHQFFGVVDASPAGFTQFEFREVNGKVGQALFIFGDDFTIVNHTPTAAPELADTQVFFSGAAPNPSGGSTTLSFSLSVSSEVRLAVYDLRGRLVRELLDEVRGTGFHSVAWDGRDHDGLAVSAGIYFGRLVARHDGTQSVLNKKIVVLH